MCTKLFENRTYYKAVLYLNKSPKQIKEIPALVPFRRAVVSYIYYQHNLGALKTTGQNKIKILGFFLNIGIIIALEILFFPVIKHIFISLNIKKSKLALLY